MDKLAGYISISTLDADALGISGLDISEQGTAQAAIDKIKAAIDTVTAPKRSGPYAAFQRRHAP